MLAAYSSGPALIPSSSGLRAWLGCPTCSPHAVQALAPSVAMGGELLTIPISRPLGSGWLSKNTAASNSSSPRRNRSTPA